ncbi:alpha-glucosidase [Sarcina sp. DSM 11001]|uniref:glycoside hydrolase family 13 protein n=1 Tax=Sarcina sp. DSM 11001 TaxID=1798184 RepID=UPI0008870867|nr:alpha amylase N-terminal ig-like domain-containing protein [Sarcina sp. DSM 11001]SDK83819.1 alpha-glucosidase [Sarcina sp. DSM 11001]
MSDRDNREPALRAVFSDTTADYITPPCPKMFEKVTIRLRIDAGEAQSCFLVTGTSWLRMHREESDGCFDYYAVQFEVTKTPLRYYFEIISRGRRFRYSRRGIRNTIRPEDYWHVIPGFDPPHWAEGAVLYQIFVDRFCNGDPSNDVLDGEYSYLGKPVRQIRDWDRPPSSCGYMEFYGGDLQGVIDKLDYLQDLGVEGIYLNPIFLSPSSHKYDTQDYEHIDPHIGRIVRDKGNLLFPDPSLQGQKPKGDRPGGRVRSRSLASGTAHGTELRSRKSSSRKKLTNQNAERYLVRVTDPANLEASDRLFAKLVREAHSRGIRVILDGVFNHCGSFHRWMDAEKIYEKLPDGIRGAKASRRSPYAEYFRFANSEWPSNDTYDAWWKFETLPKLNYDGSEELCREIIRIGKKWVSPPYCADGWRLDVAADLGYSPSFNHQFWKRFRKAVKKANPEAVILAENYTDSQKWLQGEEWDTIMNYEFFMEPLTGFLTGMEKHSDARREDLYGDPTAFWREAGGMNRNALPEAALRVSMNQLSNHDHSRFLTRTNRVVGRVQSLGCAAALQGTHMEVMRQAVLIQMTWPGAPTIYYGDEAGLTGFTDPDNRRTYPWGHEDKELIRCHKDLIALRRASKALRRGSLVRLADEDGVLAYARFFRGCAGRPSGGNRNSPAGIRPVPAESWIVLININYIEIDYEADVLCAGIPPQAELEYAFLTRRGGFISEEPASEKKASGKTMSEKSAAGGTGKEKTAPDESAAGGTGEGKTAPGESAAGGTGEGKTAPGESAAGVSGKEKTALGESAAGGIGEEKTAPEESVSEKPKEKLPGKVSVHGGWIRLCLPPESGILLRWRQTEKR